MQVMIKGKFYDIDNKDILELDEEGRAYLRPSSNPKQVFPLYAWIMAHNKEEV